MIPKTRKNEQLMCSKRVKKLILILKPYAVLFLGRWESMSDASGDRVVISVISAIR